MILADAYEAFLLDLDGVVWRGETPIPGAARVVAELRDRGRRVVFVTNNSSRTARDFAMKLFRMQIPMESGDVVTSGHAVVAELRRLGLERGERVHVCGGDGLIRQLAHDGFSPVKETDDVAAVVVGWNPEGVFDDIRKAADLVRAGLPFIASNADPTYPAEGQLLPGTGAIVAAIEVASGKKATVVGKPRPELFRLALARAAVPASKALFCGDRASTDVEGARAAGIPAALVLTGVTTEGELAGLPHLPQHVLDGLPDLLLDLPETGEGQDRLRLDVGREGKRVIVRGAHVPAASDRQAARIVLRKLLLEAVQGATAVESSEPLRPYLERLGARVEAQLRLPAV
ncbi:MAG TPA: HAD-IIA family hydrolase [Actinomycetota bacterium]|nr:HAD-IIA family hydrolase [Actinomycetota bacterium]